MVETYSIEPILPSPHSPNAIDSLLGEFFSTLCHTINPNAIIRRSNFTGQYCMIIHGAPLRLIYSVIDVVQRTREQFANIIYAEHARSPNSYARNLNTPRYEYIPLPIILDLKIYHEEDIRNPTLRMNLSLKREFDLLFPRIITALGGVASLEEVLQGMQSYLQGKTTIRETVKKTIKLRRFAEAYNAPSGISEEIEHLSDLIMHRPVFQMAKTYQEALEAEQRFHNLFCDHYYDHVAKPSLAHPRKPDPLFQLTPPEKPQRTVFDIGRLAAAEKELEEATKPAESESFKQRIMAKFLRRKKEE